MVATAYFEETPASYSTFLESWLVSVQLLLRLSHHRTLQILVSYCNNACK
ncbi:unnamed protein product [Larinioides sclopetarius]|uniref:Uncharacterized protein n=1 Tax=Larinioides sclopetarius TaxID=280406 RepID=A0AAV2AJG0_9ARAC